MMRIVTVMCLCLAGAACGNPFAADDHYYKTAIADEQRTGLTVYWVGPSFSAGGLVFDQIEGSNPLHPEDASDGALTLHYFDTDTTATLHITSFDAEAWTREKPRLFRADLRSTDSEVIAVAGHDAELYAVQAGVREINSFELAVEVPTGMAWITTNSSFDLDGGELNPLMELDTFLSVIENLRPYDEK